MEVLGQLIEDWIRENDSSQAALFHLSGVKQNTLSRWINRQVKSATTKNLKMIAPVLGLTYEDLLRRMGEIPESNPSAIVAAKRQRVRDQIDTWFTAVGPEYEDDLWEYIKTHGESTVKMISRMGTAVNTVGDTAVNAAVSGRAKRGRKPRSGPSSPLNARQRPIAERLGVVVGHSNRPVAA